MFRDVFVVCKLNSYLFYLIMNVCEVLICSKLKFKFFVRFDRC